MCRRPCSAFIQAAGTASKLQGGPPARGWARRKTVRSSSCRKGTRRQSRQPPAGCQLGVTGEAQNSRGNAETQDRHKKREKPEAGGHIPPISKLAVNCSYQDPLVLAHGQTRDEENRNERPGESLYVYSQVGWVTTLNLQGGAMGDQSFQQTVLGSKTRTHPGTRAPPAHTRHRSTIGMSLGAACRCA